MQSFMRSTPLSGGARSGVSTLGSYPASSSPAISAQAGLVFLGTRKDHTLSALNMSTGALRWSFVGRGQADLLSPSVSADGATVYHSAGYDIHALDAETGTERWAFHVGARVYGSPAISADGRTLYFGSYTKKGLHAIRVQAATCSLDASNVVLPARASGLGTCDGLSELSVRDPRGMPYIAASPPGYCSDWQYPDGPGPEYDDLTSTPEACLARCLAQVPGATSFSLRGTQCLCSATTKGTCPIITTHTVKTYRAFRVRGPTTCLPTCAPGFAGRGSVSCDGDTGRVVNTFRCVSDGIKHQERWVWGRTGWSCDDTCRDAMPGGACQQVMLDTARMEPSAFFNGVVPEAARAVCTKLTAGGDAKWAPYRWVDPKTSTFQLGECWTNSPTASARSTCGYAPSQHFESFSSPDPNAIRTSVSRLCPCKAPMGGVTEGIVKWSGQPATACWDPALSPGGDTVFAIARYRTWSSDVWDENPGELRAIRAADGVQLWKYSFGFSSVSRSGVHWPPIVAEGKLVSRDSVAVYVSSNQDFSLHAVQASDGSNCGHTRQEVGCAASLCRHTKARATLFIGSVDQASQSEQWTDPCVEQSVFCPRRSVRKPCRQRRHGGLSPRSTITWCGQRRGWHLEMDHTDNHALR